GLLLADGIPVVAADREISHPEVDAILVDNVVGAHAACRHLIDLGHRHIAHVAGRPRTKTGQDRACGYRWALEEAGIPVDPSLVVWGDFSFDSGYLLTQRLLARCPRPTAIFAANDLMAFGAMQAAEEAGVRVPEELSVVGFDDIPMAGVMRPGLTTVSQPSYEMGRLALTMLLERINGQVSGIGRKHTFEPKLIIRSTTRRREPSWLSRSSS
ncbi:MAG: substrate-binding domain-containing protein, partial [Bacillota bacterium]